MKILQRYFLTQILKSVVFVLVAFIGLFAFFDLINEIPVVGKGRYHLFQAIIYILLGIPAYVYELMPFAVLIGAIYAMATFANNSEFTIMRVSSLSTLDAVKMMVKVGVIFLIFTFAVGEGVSPITSRKAADFKNSLIEKNTSEKLKTGMWSKDIIRKDGNPDTVVGNRYMNFKVMNPNGRSFEFARIFEFNNKRELVKIITAEKGKFKGGNTWILSGVEVEDIRPPSADKEKKFPDTAPLIQRTKLDTMTLNSEVTPKILAVTSMDPNRMSAVELMRYNRHLDENKQDASLYKIAFWKKIIYPFTVFVMMGLALPFAYLHFRSGGISLKIFVGIMIGIAFVLFNNLFSHIGLLNGWPAFLTAVFPSLLFLLCAVYALWWVEKH
ncbi:MAG: LPS export ABC transporter permease LptG [Oxalobacter sp.]|nr:LPS export ABC transporter permease LptG [Oxalobacter sp.]